MVIVGDQRLKISFALRFNSQHCFLPNVYFIPASNFHMSDRLAMPWIEGEIYAKSTDSDTGQF